MIRQELYELLNLNGGVTGGCNADYLITAIKFTGLSWINKPWKQAAHKEKTFL